MTWHSVCAPVDSPPASNFESIFGSKKFKPFFQLKEGECQCNSGGCQCRGGPLNDYMDWASIGVSWIAKDMKLIHLCGNSCLFGDCASHTLQELLSPSMSFVVSLIVCIFVGIMRLH